MFQSSPIDYHPSDGLLGLLPPQNRPGQSITLNFTPCRKLFPDLGGISFPTKSDKLIVCPNGIAIRAVQKETKSVKGKLVGGVERGGDVKRQNQGVGVVKRVVCEGRK